MTIRYLGIITRKNSSEVRACGTSLAAWFERRGIRTELDRIDASMDMLVILGGDGTLLHVADQAARYGIPVVGINLGQLGFLTEVAADEMYPALEEILAGNVSMEKRMMLQVRLLDGKTGQVAPPGFALNEVAIVKGNVEPVVRLCCWADREYITTYKADGLIVATPTGSTAYNLSAGGPIVQAELDTILVTPICPFMLESRPVLLAPQTRITAQLADPAQDVKVLVDGRLQWEIGQTDCLVIESSDNPLYLISSPTKGYFAILRNKLNWGGRDPGLPLPEQVERLA